MSIVCKCYDGSYRIDRYTMAYNLKEFKIRSDIYDPFTNYCNTGCHSLKNFDKLFKERSKEETLFIRENKVQKVCGIYFGWAVLNMET